MKKHSLIRVLALLLALVMLLTACGGRKDPCSDGHTYDNGCDTECNICSETRRVNGHRYDNGCDTECNECGATREANHEYDNACDTDCNVCGATRTVGEHA